MTTDIDIRPFSFEDLAGKDEPASWGPVYDVKRKKGQTVSETLREMNERWWRADPVFHSNSPSGQAFEFSAAKHRAKLKAEFSAQCARDRKAWATGEAIKSAYAEAMRLTGIRRAALAAVEASLAEELAIAA